MPDVRRLAADVVGNAAASGVPGGYRGQHPVVDGSVTDLGVLGQQVTSLAEERELRAEHSSQHPGVEVGQRLGSIVGHEFTTVSGGAADNRVHKNG